MRQTVGSVYAEWKETVIQASGYGYIYNFNSKGKDYR